LRRDEKYLTAGSSSHYLTPTDNAMKALLLSLALLACARPADCQKTPILFQHVRVFDGLKTISVTNVLIQDGRIRDLGFDVAEPSAQVVDGTGLTLLPGLIDSHVHVHGAEALEQSMIFGVTSEFDMMMQPRLMAALKNAEKSNMADFWSAGWLATAPGGHGTEYGLEVPTITDAKKAQAWVDARIAEGSDYIKLVYDDATEYGGRGSRPTLSKQLMKAIIDAAHQRGKLAVVHIGSEWQAQDAINAGADGLAHLFVGSTCDRSFGALVAAHHAFVIPTLTVLHSICGPTASRHQLISDLNLEPFLTPGNIARLRETFPSSSAGLSCAGAAKAIKELKAAGVPILAGTDAPNPGTTYGASLHEELVLLVEAGLTPLEALVAATSASAQAFHVQDRGRIAPGLRADLVLVKGNPDEDILATRNIMAVYKAGIAIDRAAAKARR
jgi:imidazolonepropionase-like amidohydrolase